MGIAVFKNTAMYQKMVSGLCFFLPGNKRLEQLPLSGQTARQCRGGSYIRYTGKLDKKTGISFTASDGDYSELKASLLASCFEKMSVRNAYRRYNDAVYVFDGKVTSNFLEKEELVILGFIIPIH